MSNFSYRAINPRNDDDINKYFELKNGLNDFLKSKATVDDQIVKWQRCHFGAPEYALPDRFKDKPLPPLEENADEFAFVCEKDGEFIGYIEVLSYHLVEGKRPDDDIGAIHEIYVKEMFQGKNNISFTLLQMGVDKLIEKGKNRAICDVQEDNPNRFLHFAMADGNIVRTSKCKRRNGADTIDYTLLIDLKKLKDMTPEQLILKTARYKKNMLNKKESGLNL